MHSQYAANSTRTPLAGLNTQRLLGAPRALAASLVQPIRNSQRVQTRDCSTRRDMPRPTPIPGDQYAA
eukprot:6879397-Alexandrium_andersonii.AAC.1